MGGAAIMITSGKWFWENRELMDWLSNERMEVYFKYIDRVLERIKAGHMPAHDIARFHQFLKSQAEEADKANRSLRRLICH
jgi:hypothetical protein